MDNKRQDDTSRVENSTVTLLPLDTVFTILSNQRRRMILSHLTRCKYPVPFEELVETVTTQEIQASEAEPSDTVYKRIAMDLYNTQLPKLAHWGVIDYHEDLQLIRPADTVRPLDEFLRLAEQHDRDWQDGDTHP